MPKTEGIFSKLHGATVSSRLDFKDAYHQITISENSRNITDFTTPQGTFRFAKLPFGLACSPAKSARTLHRATGNISSVLSNFLSKYTQEHDAALRKLEMLSLAMNLKSTKRKA